MGCLRERKRDGLKDEGEVKGGEREGESKRERAWSFTDGKATTGRALTTLKVLILV